MTPRLDRPAPWLTPLATRVLGFGLLAIGIAAFVRPFFFSDWYGNDEVDRYPGRLELLYAHATWTAPLPRWIPELSGGHGYPLFNFFNAGSMFVALPFRALGLDPFTATKVALVVMLLVGIGHAMALGRRLYGEGAGVLVGMLTLAAPYTIANFYHRGDFAEGWANLLFPVVLYHDVALREASRPRVPWGSFVALALAWAALVPAHAFSALLFAVAFAIRFVVRALVHRRRHGRFCRGDVLVFGASTLGVLLATIYWLPALGEKSTVRIDEFFSLDKLMSSALSWGDLLDPTPEGRTAAHRRLTLGAFVPVLIAIVVWHLRKRPELPRRALTWGWIVGCALALFMTTRAAEPVYAALPLIGQILFPYRFLGLATLFGVLAAARVVPLLFAPHQRALGGLALGAFALVLALPHLQLTNPVDFPEGHADYPSRATREVILFDYGEYYPKRVEGMPGRAAQAFEASAGCAVEENAIDGTRHDLVVVAERACEVTLAQFDWLGWQATLDGAPATIDPDARGQIRVAVPAGRHRVVIDRSDTRLENAAAVVSAVALVVLFFLLGLALVGLAPKRRWAAWRAALRPVGPLPAALLGEADALEARRTLGDEAPDVLDDAARALDRRARELAPQTWRLGRRRQLVVAALATLAVSSVGFAALRPRPRLVAHSHGCLGGDPTFGPDRAIDGLETTAWRGWEARAWLEVSLVPPRPITQVELLNGGLLDGTPRAVERFVLEVFDEDESLHRIEGVLGPSERQVFEVPSPRATRVRLEARSAHGPTAGLTELEVR
ncbi:MAG: hypothetical protein H6722_21925 [Sandaracinus sp.]|nr:hypothetical protein [Sandaracinus sp.]